jgi:hypothetical protein
MQTKIDNKPYRACDICGINAFKLYQANNTYSYDIKYYTLYREEIDKVFCSGKCSLANKALDF